MLFRVFFSAIFAEYRTLVVISVAGSTPIVISIALISPDFNSPTGSCSPLPQLGENGPSQLCSTYIIIPLVDEPGKFTSKMVQWISVSRIHVSNIQYLHRTFILKYIPS
jgi:hypothetical protein